ncbi:acyltransferase family protein [Prevotella sp. 10(H)]|uniref:acyltransferase family protein n=1 Tax=Prevotella sp. 10(H) TaxID=1158294 RepID=UPI000AF6C585|nr:acyltransferase family protein [Prevotella sp. 10(H)]
MAERDPFFDSLKFVLILFVVFGHTMEYHIHFSTYHIESAAYTFMYTFNMPLFVFVSGYFSKNVTWSRYKPKFWGLVMSYIVFQTILFIPYIVNGTFSLRYYLFYPQKVMWYIPALLVWRFTFCFIPKLKLSFPVIFIISLILSLLIGYQYHPSPLFYAPSKILVFLPYFILGYYCPKKSIEKIRKMDKEFSVAIIVVIIGLIYTTMPSQQAISFYGTIPYTQLFPGEETLGLVCRLSTYIISIIVSCAIISLVTTKLAKWGDRTLDIYLLHAPLVYLVYVKLIETYHWNTNIFIDFIVFLIIIFICLFLSKQKIIQYLINPITIFQKNKSTIKS